MRVIESYLHGKDIGIPATIGVLVDIQSNADDKLHREELSGLAYDLAMQIAATNPTHVGDSLIQSDTETENDELPDLLMQPFIKDPSKLVREVIYECEQKIGASIFINRFIRYAIRDT